MRRQWVVAVSVFVLGGFCCSQLFAQDGSGAGGPGIQLTYNPGSSKKLEQIAADCDWVVWDATIVVDAQGNITNPNPTCQRTVSQTTTRADVLGQGLGYSFEDEGKLIFLFGDTFGATLGKTPAGLPDGNAYYPTWTHVQNPFQYLAGDTMAWSTTSRPEDGLLLNYFLASDKTHALIVQPEYTTPQCYPDGTCGTALPMGADDIPNSGISLDGQIYIVASTGTISQDYSLDYSVLAKFDEAAGTFSAGRTISSVPAGGHFVYTSLREFPPGAEGWNVGGGQPFVVIFGVGEYDASNIYLSIVPKSGFESGAGTRYFTGLDSSGSPTWGAEEGSSNVPVVTDVENPPTIGNLSAMYSADLGLWLMTFNGGHGNSTTSGVYFSYARVPWGPWSTPQHIFNDCADQAYGNYIFYYYDPLKPATNVCPSAVVYPANTSGPAGPTIGPQDSSGNPPEKTRGGGFAPQMIERFTEVEGNTLKIYYTLSTWNPYAVVKMESDFTIAGTP
jgi:hypothetical protein